MVMVKFYPKDRLRGPRVARKFHLRWIDRTSRSGMAFVLPRDSLLRGHIVPLKCSPRCDPTSRIRIRSLGPPGLRGHRSNESRLRSAVRAGQWRIRVGEFYGKTWISKVSKGMETVGEKKKKFLRSLMLAGDSLLRVTKKADVRMRSRGRSVFKGFTFQWGIFDAKGEIKVVLNGVK